MNDDETVSAADKREITRLALTQWHDVKDWLGSYREVFAASVVADWPETGPYSFRVLEDRWEDNDRRRTILRAELVSE